MLNLEFPLAAEEPGGPHDLLLRLRDSKLKDDILLDTFYDKIIESYEYVGNYLILVIHDVYDVPGKASDGMEMEDAYLVSVITYDDHGNVILEQSQYNGGGFTMLEYTYEPFEVTN